MKTIKVKLCGDCPWCVSEMFVVNMRCTLWRDRGALLVREKQRPPDACPLRDEAVRVKVVG